VSHLSALHPSMGVFMVNSDFKNGISVIDKLELGTNQLPFIAQYLYVHIVNPTKMI